MSRAQCIDCGTAVVVDPTGRCPEGHEVGAEGARVAQAMGSDQPHPDEPEPWIATVTSDEVQSADQQPEPRVARPPAAPGAGAEQAVASDAGTGSDDSEELLRELHALAELDLTSGSDATGTPPPAPAPDPAPAATPPSAQEPASSVPAPRDGPDSQAAEELSALEAALRTLGAEGEQPTDAPPADTSPEPATSAVPPPPPPPPATPPPHTGPTQAAASPAQPSPAQPRSTAPPPPLRVVQEPPTPPRSTAAEPPADVPAPERDAEAPPAEQEAQAIDITNFTARGRKVDRSSSGKRRLFGR